MNNAKVSARQLEIVTHYLYELDKHLSDLEQGKAERTLSCYYPEQHHNNHF